MISRIQNNNLVFSSSNISQPVRADKQFSIKSSFTGADTVKFNSVSFGTSVKVHKLLPALKKLGFKDAGQKGSHLFLEHPDGRWTTVPIHGKGEIAEGLLNAIIKQVGITKKEFFKYL